MTTKKTTKPDPQDGTMRNVRASNRRDATLAQKIAKLAARVTALEALVKPRPRSAGSPYDASRRR